MIIIVHITMTYLTLHVPAFFSAPVVSVIKTFLIVVTVTSQMARNYDVCNHRGALCGSFTSPLSLFPLFSCPSPPSPLLSSLLLSPLFSPLLFLLIFLLPVLSARFFPLYFDFSSSLLFSAVLSSPPVLSSLFLLIRSSL